MDWQHEQCSGTVGTTPGWRGITRVGLGWGIRELGKRQLGIGLREHWAGSRPHARKSSSLGH
jgi:hypothetical protein